MAAGFPIACAKARSLLIRRSCGRIRHYLTLRETEVLPELLMAGKLVLAAVLGGVVGWEREVHERPAGLRTHVLVCMGSALITLISLSFARPNDPGRIAAQIVSGIGFLGAGTILRQGNIVRGLTTAASLWTVAGIGMAIAVGGSFLWLAVFATLIVFLTLSTMSRFEYVLGMKSLRDLMMEIPGGNMQSLTAILRSLMEHGLTIRSIKMEDSPVPDMKIVRMKVSVPRRASERTVSTILTEQPEVTRFEWT